MGISCGNIVSEYNSQGRLTASYLRGIGLAEAKDSQGSLSYYLHNAHGDVTALAAANGSILNSYSYDAFGNTISSNVTAANRFMYSGEQYDSITGEYYLRARFYNPVLGRFMQEDTYRGDGLNLYAYVANNPLRYVDPSGHEKISNLRKYEGFGYKKDAMIKIAQVLLSEGYEPAFVAGLLANIAHEGSPGVFERSNYGSFKLLSNDKDNGRYLDYEDSGNYKKKGAYLIYMDQYMNYSKDFSGKTISEVGLDNLNALFKKMKEKGAQSVVAGKWKNGEFLGYYDKQSSGGFGIGMIQWTFGRAEGLIEYYNTKKFNKDGFPTQEESLETEIEYMVKELKSASYSWIYGDGKKYDSSNKDAAYLAGYNICMNYEIPWDTENKAKARGTYAREVYSIMMGGL